MMIESKARYDAKTDMLYLVSDEGKLARSIEAILLQTFHYRGVQIYTRERYRHDTRHE